jgi:hypothetical protein
VAAKQANYSKTQLCSLESDKKSADKGKPVYDWDKNIAGLGYKDQTIIRAD